MWNQPGKGTPSEGGDAQMDLEDFIRALPRQKEKKKKTDRKKLLTPPLPHH